MESNFYSPTNQVKVDLNSLERFWKSSDPKFGNEGATGWQEFIKKGNSFIHSFKTLNESKNVESYEEESFVDEDQVSNASG